MTAHFAPAVAPILLQAIVTGPQVSWEIRLALDTGATRTLIRASTLASLGIRPVAVTYARQLAGRLLRS